MDSPSLPPTLQIIPNNSCIFISLFTVSFPFIQPINIFKSSWYSIRVFLISSLFPQWSSLSDPEMLALPILNPVLFLFPRPLMSSSTHGLNFQP